MGLTEQQCLNLVEKFYLEFEIDPDSNRYISGHSISNLETRNDINPIPLYGDDSLGDLCIVFFCKEIPDQTSPFPANIYRGTRIFYEPDSMDD